MCENMCIPVKLLVLRTLDKILDTHTGLQAFISSTPHQENKIFNLKKSFISSFIDIIDI